ncbi:hypothetical protein E2R66_12880 [Mucilaginibacter psychrotolerans]|uniref:Peptidase C39 domain-containing protein n=1 Tax=Mucilaginibacter psychrotolerans TaxID=1524096 RepID=A0A4Y8SE45_9SPHI|nr:hypothetical protein E2R66_12880 [Mucilaginibacter psychrotolerans]
MKLTSSHYAQPDQMDCGPTCLRTVAKHFGRNWFFYYKSVHVNL